jgi:hypothetical protein
MKDRRVVFMMRMQVVYLQGEKFPFLCLGSGGLCALIAAAFFLLHCIALHIVACKKRLGACGSNQLEYLSHLPPRSGFMVQPARTRPHLDASQSTCVSE